MPRSIVAACALVLLAACSSGRNYPAPQTPRFTGTPSELRVAEPDATPAEIVVVSFNVKEGRAIDRALESLAQIPAPDILLLQEMDARGTARIADTLGMAWVYYPASRRDERGFGNAVLSRYPIVDDAKLVLPHDAWIVGTQRTATAATIRMGAVEVRVHSVHLATPLAQWPWNRAAQLDTILADAERFPLVVVGGDLNSGGVAARAVARGWAWPTEEGPGTTWWGRVDHVLLRGLSASDAGTGTDPADASDHRPVWVRIDLGSLSH